MMELFNFFNLYNMFQRYVEVQKQNPQGGTVIDFKNHLNTNSFQAKSNPLQHNISQNNVAVDYQTQMNPFTRIIDFNNQQNVSNDINISFPPQKNTNTSNISNPQKLHSLGSSILSHLSNKISHNKSNNTEEINKINNNNNMNNSAKTHNLGTPTTFLPSKFNNSRQNTANIKLGDNNIFDMQFNNYLDDGNGNGKNYDFSQFFLAESQRNTGNILLNDNLLKDDRRYDDFLRDELNVFEEKKKTIELYRCLGRKKEDEQKLENLILKEMSLENNLNCFPRYRTNNVFKQGNLTDDVKLVFNDNLEVMFQNNFEQGDMKRTKY